MTKRFALLAAVTVLGTLALGIFIHQNTISALQRHAAADLAATKADFESRKLIAIRNPLPGLRQFSWQMADKLDHVNPESMDPDAKSALKSAVAAFRELADCVTASSTDYISLPEAKTSLECVRPKYQAAQHKFYLFKRIVVDGPLSDIYARRAAAIWNEAVAHESQGQLRVAAYLYREANLASGQAEIEYNQSGALNTSDRRANLRLNGDARRAQWTILDRLYGSDSSFQGSVMGNIGPRRFKGNAGRNQIAGLTEADQAEILRATYKVDQPLAEELAKVAEASMGSAHYSLGGELLQEAAELLYQANVFDTQPSGAAAQVFAADRLVFEYRGEAFTFIRDSGDAFLMGELKRVFEILDTVSKL